MTTRLIQPIEERRAIVADILGRVCEACGVPSTEVLAPGSRRRQVVPRRAVAVAVREVLGWKVRHVLVTCGISKALLINPSGRHLRDALFEVCRQAAQQAAECHAPATVLAKARAKGAEAARREDVRLRILASMRRQAAEHRLRLEELATERASTRTLRGRRIAAARRAVIVESIAAGASRREIADAFGVWPETVSRIISGRLH